MVTETEKAAVIMNSRYFYEVIRVLVYETRFK